MNKEYIEHYLNLINELDQIELDFEQYFKKYLKKLQENNCLHFTFFDTVIFYPEKNEVKILFSFYDVSNSITIPYDVVCGGDDSMDKWCDEYIEETQINKQIDEDLENAINTIRHLKEKYNIDLTEIDNEKGK